MLPRKPTLEIDSVRRFDRAVGRKFNGRALHESASCHDNWAVVAWHIPRFRGNEAVDRGSCLDTLAECDDAFRFSKGHRLNDVVTALGSVWNNGKSQFLINICSKDSTF